ncbi:MAG TPA: phosphodiester glycosidase family protein [Solirubrobacteraceae bacterium]|nr:phosphodiester glycosidase family protein [Solirubrobacteraceae bacterium]
MLSPSREAIERYEARILAYELRRDCPAGRRHVPRRTRAARPTALQLRARRIVVLTALIVMFDLVLSFWGAMAGPSNVPLGVRAVEWLRDNGAAGLVSDVEAIYYSLNAPPTGGSPLERLPQVGSGALVQVANDAPARISPVISPALPGEGQWHGTGPSVGGVAPILVTTFRSDPSYPQLVAGLAWIDHTRTRLALYPGRYEPPNDGAPPAQVPLGLRSSLLAVFNSGFKLEDSGGGFFSQGHLYAPLRSGQATLIGYRDGAVDVRAWAGGSGPGPGISFARQNLPLIVENGRLDPALSNDALWGTTLGNTVRVWRSGVGIDAHGNLIYAAADIQTAASLASILQRAGAVRAMELDINYEWTTFNFYRTFGAGDPAKLLPGMSRPATRYLVPDDRDFFAVYAR